MSVWARQLVIRTRYVKVPEKTSIICVRDKGFQPVSYSVPVMQNARSESVDRETGNARKRYALCCPFVLPHDKLMTKKKRYERTLEQILAVFSRTGHHSHSQQLRLTGLALGCDVA